MVEHVACITNRGVGEIAHHADALLEFRQRIAVFPPLLDAVVASDHTQGGRGDAFVNGLGFVGFEKLRADHLVCRMAQNSPLALRVGTGPVLGQPVGFVSAKTGVGFHQALGYCL